MYNFQLKRKRYSISGFSVFMPSIIDVLLSFSASGLFVVNCVLNNVPLSFSYKFSAVIYALFFPFVLAWCSSYKCSNKRLIALSVVGSFLFSQFVLFGSSYTLCTSTELCFGSSVSILIWILESFVFGYIGYRIISSFVTILEYHNIKGDGNEKINIKKWLLLSLTAKVVCFIIFFPTIFDADSALGLRTLLDPNEVKCDMNPFFVMLVHGGAYLLGDFFGNISLGFAVLSLVNITVDLLIFLYLLYLIDKSVITGKAKSIFAAIFAFFPLYPILSVYAAKDGFFAYAVLLYSATIFQMAITRGNCLKNYKFLLLHSLSILLVCLTRKQGIFITSIEFVLLLIIFRNQWLKLSVATILSFILIFSFSSIIKKSNVEPTTKAEMLGMLFQQSIYYMKQYPDEVDPTDYDVINSLIDVEKSKARFCPDFVDRVKGSYRYNPFQTIPGDTLIHYAHINHAGESEKIREYLSTWLKMGIKHPLCYVEATCLVVNGFFYNTGSPMLTFDRAWLKSKQASPKYSFSMNTIILDKVPTIASYGANIPIINFVFAIPYYIWFVILCFLLIIYRRDRYGLAIIMPTMISIAVLVLCPVVVGRYVYPIVTVLPLIVLYVLTFNKSENGKNCNLNSVL